jgi:glycerol-3-phosphate O-acyltransferase
MSGLLRRFLALWVKAEVRPDDAAVRIGAVTGAPVCYVLERNSRTDLAALENVCARLQLARPDGRVIGRGAGRAVDAHFALYQARGLFDARIDRRPPESLTRLIGALRVDPSLDVRLVPVAVYWGRAPQKEGSWLRLLLSENWVLGGSLRKLLQVTLNGRFTMIEFGDPQSLRSALAAGGADSVESARIARNLRSRFRRQRASRIGPDLSHRRTIVARVLRTRAVRAAMASEMRDRKIDRKRAIAVAKGYAEEIAANYSHVFVVSMERLLARLWTRLYDGVEFQHRETLRDLSRDSELVYVPCHRSHMDYLLLSYVIYREGYAIPHIAAGINLNIAVIGRFLRKGGAFFIRRSFGGNALYTVVFMRYLGAIMARGHAIEYFIEGGRSRTGRLLQPRTGMLSMTVRSHLREPKRPLVFVPVYFGYERIVEADTYVDELSGRPKTRESALDLLRSLRVLREKFGRVHVNIGEPIPLDALIEARVPEWRSLRFDDDVRAPWIAPLVDELAGRIMRNINSAAAVTPINLLALTLLATPRQAMLEEDLVQQIDLYLALLRTGFYGSRVTVTSMVAAQCVPYGESMKVIQRQAHKLGDVIRVTDQAAVQLTYYRNNVLHLFALPSLLACAFLGNATVRTEDLQRLAWRIYPYVASELFLRWNEAELEAAVRGVLGALAVAGILEPVPEHAAWRRPAPTSPRAIQLSNLAQSTVQTIERYYLAIALLRQVGSGQIAARALAERCQLMAQRINLLYGFNSPEFSDRAMFETFIALLIERAVLRVDEQGRLLFDEVLERIAVDAEFVLSEQIRHSILQVTHV